MEEQNTFFEEWKKWLNADYAFSNNGEKIKKVAKVSYTISLALFFIASGIGICNFLIETFNGGFEYVWWIPIIIVTALLLVPFFIYWNLSFLYGFGELISNSYANKIKIEKNLEVSTTQPEPNQQFNCYSCGNKVNFGDANCKICGASFDWNKI